QLNTGKPFEVKAKEPEIILGTMIKDEKIEMETKQEQPKHNMPPEVKKEEPKLVVGTTIKIDIPQIQNPKSKIQNFIDDNPIRNPQSAIRNNEDSLLSLMQKVGVEKIEEMSKLPIFKPQENTFIPMHQEKGVELLHRILPVLFQESMNFKREKEEDNIKPEDKQKSFINLPEMFKSVKKRIVFTENRVNQQDESGVLKDNNINLTYNSAIQGTNRVEIPASLPDASMTNLIFKEILYEFIEEASLHLKKDSSEIQVKLKPEYLGKLELKITQQDGKIFAKFVVENFELKELIESELASLKEILVEKGLDLQGIEVYVGQEPGKNLEERHQRYIDNIKISSYNEEDEKVGERGDENRILINASPGGNKLFWFISKIDFIA
ncbi:MAG: flagellar hook-length control protein FliK, partial [bacterium]